MDYVIFESSLRYDPSWWRLVWVAARLVAGGGWRWRGDIENDVADWPAAQTQAAPGPVYPSQSIYNDVELRQPIRN